MVATPYSTSLYALEVVHTYSDTSIYIFRYMYSHVYMHHSFHLCMFTDIY